MTTYNCPRCGRPSTPERCPACGRGPEPLLSRLDGLDTALRHLGPDAQSRGPVEAERLGVLADLGRLAASYRGQGTPQAPATPPREPQTPPGFPQAPTGPAAPRQGPPMPATPQPMPGTQATPPQTPLPPPPRPRGEVASKTVQTVLLGLGGLLLAAAIIIFTAVAWRHMGDAGRLTVLAVFTTLLLCVPPALNRFRLWATAETFASLAALALWCSALAGYYQLLPDRATLSAEAVGTWSMLVVALLAAYRTVVRATSVGWAILALAAIGSAYAAAGDVVSAALLMAAMAVVLGGASWIVANRPSRYVRSDLWSQRLLLCGGVVLAFLAGLRVAFDLDQSVLGPVAAAVALLAAANLLATLYARGAGASVTALLVASSATAAMVVASWVLAVRSGEAALVVPSLALLAAAIAAGVDELAGTRGTASRIASALACIATLAAFAIVVAGAPELLAYLFAAVAVALVALALLEPLRRSTRHAAYLGGAAVGVTGVFTSLWAMPMAWWGLDPPGLLTWEVPIVMTLLAFTAPLVPAARRLDLVSVTVMFAIVGTGALLHHGDADRFDTAPVAAFATAAVIALIAAMASPTLAGRCTGWALLTVWTPVTAASAYVSDALDVNAIGAQLGTVAGAAAMLVVAAGAPRRSRPDRVLGAILAHVLAGVTVASMAITDWVGQIIASSDDSLYLPAAMGVYTLALTGAALMAPVRKWAYTIAALSVGTAAWWALLAALGSETIEFYTTPPAMALFIIGLWHLVRQPETGSWAALSAAISVGLGPSLLVALGDDGTVVRRVGVGAAALVVLVAGLARRWQAPLVLGAVALLILTVNELVLVWHAIPSWIPPALGGAILLALGATFERRRRDLSRLRDGLRSMR